MTLKNILVVSFVTLCFNNAFAQDRAPNIPAEGPFRDPDGVLPPDPQNPYSQHRQFGVNRRVAIGRPDDTRNIGFTGISGTFTVQLQVPTGSGVNNQDPGQLPNKPTFYFGIRGPGRYWPRNNSNWIFANSVEVDAGLEYDSRSTFRGQNVRGWRAFISINGVQTNYSLATGPWRGQANQYRLNFRIDRDGVPHLLVNGYGGNFEFAWNHTNNLSMDGESIYPQTSDRLIGLKKVIADTRPDPGPGNVVGNYALDGLNGLRFTCLADDVK